MIRTGDTIHNPVTGERITFHATSADTNGESVVIECTVQPDGFVAATHLHPSQSERFAVIEGTLGVKVGKEKRTLGQGEIAIVEPGTPHRFWNGGNDEVALRAQMNAELIAPSLPARAHRAPVVSSRAPLGSLSTSRACGDCSGCVH